MRQGLSKAHGALRFTVPLPRVRRSRKVLFRCSSITNLCLLTLAVTMYDATWYDTFVPASKPATESLKHDRRQSLLKPTSVRLCGG